VVSVGDVYIGVVSVSDACAGVVSASDACAGEVSVSDVCAGVVCANASAAHQTFSVSCAYVYISNYWGLYVACYNMF